MPELLKSDTIGPSISISTINEFNKFNYLMYRSEMYMAKTVHESQDVYINQQNLNKIAKTIMRFALECGVNDNFKRNVFGYFRHSDDFYSTKNDKMMLDRLFVLNSLNYSLWYPRTAKQWTVNGQMGYKALCSVMRRAIDEGRPMWNPRYYSQLSQCEVEVIFRGDDPKIKIPLIDERVRTLHEIGKVLLDKYKGTFVNCVNACEGDALQLLYLLFNEFKSYRDIVNYGEKKVYFGSKAAVLISDLFILGHVFACTNATSAIFVDHFVPRALLHLDILRFSDRLKTKLADTEEPLKYGSREEIEIRCCSLYVCKILSYKLLQLFTRCSVQENPLVVEEIKYYTLIMVENFLWCYRHSMDRDGFDDNVPYNNIGSVYYY